MLRGRGECENKGRGGRASGSLRFDVGGTDVSAAGGEGGRGDLARFGFEVMEGSGGGGGGGSGVREKSSIENRTGDASGEVSADSLGRAGGGGIVGVADVTDAADGADIADVAGGACTTGG